MATKLCWPDRLLYRFILIPRTRKAFLQGDSVILDSGLWKHSRYPRSDDPSFRKRMQELETGLTGPEKTALDEYLNTYP